MDQGILDYIKEAEAQGVGKYDIRQQLLKSGWPKEVVDEHMNASREGITDAAAAPPVPQTPTAAKRGMPGWLFPLGAVVLVLLYFLTFEQDFFGELVGPNWTVQLLVSLFVWAWIMKAGYHVSAKGGIALAVVTPIVFIMGGGLRLITVSLALAIVYAIIGRRWPEETARFLVIGINIFLLIWYVAGLVNPGARASLI